jgi:hypothetical protein
MYQHQVSKIINVAIPLTKSVFFEGIRPTCAARRFLGDEKFKMPPIFLEEKKK